MEPCPLLLLLRYLRNNEEDKKIELNFHIIQIKQETKQTKKHYHMVLLYFVTSIIIKMFLQTDGQVRQEE